MRINDYFAKAITWDRSDDAEFPYNTVLDGTPVTIRLDDFPADNLYTLIANGSEISFDAWPSLWAKRRQKAVRFKTVPSERLVKA